ncbi:MAG: hypothetical protein JST_000352 [Candidatus Parcubacteria bacterium]|jgi:hypothetical protein|nr:MAG: hypothetical protein JST_3230 [Candidatus Parcubacteria bacterium]
MDLLGRKIEQAPVPSSPEVLTGPERKSEQAPERGAEKGETAPVTVPMVTPVAPVAKEPPTYKERRAKLIDETLSEGLGNTYLAMSPERQKVFKVKGEETVAKINNLLDETKVKINKIVSLIKKWLSLIVGVNKFYLDQEAKIKADKILNLKDKL